MDQATGKAGPGPLTAEAIEEILRDRKTIAFLRTYLAIPDETVKTHLRRLVNELARTPPEAMECAQG